MRSALLFALALLAAPLAAQTPPATPSATLPLPPQPPQPPQPPLIRVQLPPEARLPVELARVSVEAEVSGRLALTRIELELRNPNERVLEGTLEFPLAEGQTVSGFALDIEGELRAAVPVEKAKGRQVFEDVTRTRVDPALLESAQGAVHRLRVYPLPARGSRRVVLELTETLSPTAGPGPGLRWRLPLAFSGPVGAIQIKTRFPGVAPSALNAQWGAQALRAQRDTDGSALLVGSRPATAGATAPADLRVDLRPPGGPRSDGAGAVVSTSTYQNGVYFHAELEAPAARMPRPAPARLALIWDASGSGARRDHARELALLDRYLRQLGQVEVRLVVVRDVAEPVETFRIRGGDWADLRLRLNNLAYDGATALGAMEVPTGSDLALVFTDGLGNYGGQPLPDSAVPRFMVGAANGTDAALLRHAGLSSGGGFIDLLRTDTADALRQLTQTQPRLVGLRGDGALMLESASALPEDGRWVVAGVLTQPEARVELDLLAPDGRRSTRHFTVRAPDRPSTSRPGLAALRWAGLRLARLQADATRHRTEIRRLGERFGLVTAETSLIVLDSLADYVRHEIEPPEGLRAEYQRQMAAKASRDATEQVRHLDRVAARLAEKQRWWETDFPKGEPPPPPPQPPRPAGIAGSPEPRALPAPAPARAAPPAPSAAPSAAARVADAAAPGAPESGGTAIRLRKWVPDAPYVRRLRQAPAADLYAIYLDERSAWAESSAFFMDAAEILYERGQPALAARALSNLAEMSLGNRHLLRLLAYRLTQLGHARAALPVLEQVLALAPDEPQSWRDLGLALADDGQHQRALDHLWEVVRRPWNNRFPGVELIALAELNALVVRHEASGEPPLDTSAIDPRLLRNLPLDLRVVLTWDADNTDIDLWVIDPNGERAFYGRRLTYQGGRMSDDFTGGYGPEEFSLRRAKPGVYTVRAQFYGHNQQIVAPATTLMLRLSTGFGTPDQKDENVILRLSGRGQEVTIGTFDVRPPAR